MILVKNEIKVEDLVFTKSEYECPCVEARKHLENCKHLENSHIYVNLCNLFYFRQDMICPLCNDTRVLDFKVPLNIIYHQLDRPIDKSEIIIKKLRVSNPSNYVYIRQGCEYIFYPPLNPKALRFPDSFLEENKLSIKYKKYVFWKLDNLK